MANGDGTGNEERVLMEIVRIDAPESTCNNVYLQNVGSAT